MVNNRGWIDDENPLGINPHELICLSIMLSISKACEKFISFLFSNQLQGIDLLKFIMKRGFLDDFLIDAAPSSIIRKEDWHSY
jgi:hypothetical protein